MSQNNIYKSYEKHSEHDAKIAAIGEKPSEYTRPDSVDAWRHRKMLDTLIPLVEKMPDSGWLTVGDGKYGTEAHYLEKQGIDVTATSLNDATLKVACELGYIKRYKKMNAEALDLENNMVDFILCKESYHHFPRPPIALYEMLRVSKTAVILIEPMEEGWRLFDWFKLKVKAILGRHAIEFETTGNYLYRTNPWEIRKLLIAGGFPCMALKNLNDFYLPRFSMHPDKGSMGSIVTKLGIFIQDIFCRLGLLNWGLGVFVIFKTPPDKSIIRNMSSAGYKFYFTPQNPYI